MFSENIHNYRKSKGYSQEQLAEILGVSRQTIYNWESGTSYPDVEKLIEISQLIGCSLDDLVRHKVDVFASREVNVDTATKDMVSQEFKRFALGISSGTFLILTGISIFLFLLLHESISNLPLAFLGFGIPGLAGILILSYSGLRHNAFRSSYDLTGVFTKEERQQYFFRYSLYVTLGIGLILIGVMFVVIFYQVLDFTIWPVSLAFLIVGSGVALLIYHSIILSKYSDYGEKKPTTRETLLYDKVSTIIMLTATLIYLACGFIWHLWHVAWVVFVFGGILSQIVYTIMKKD